MASIGGGGDAGSSREELKSQFTTREGTYRLTSAVEFSRSSRSVSFVTNNTNPAPGTSPPVRLSFVTLAESRPGVDAAPSESRSNSPGSGPPEASSPGAMSPSGVNVISNNINNVAATNGESAMISHGSEHHDSIPDLFSTPHRFCVNMGKELYVYPYMASRKDGDFMSKPIDKRVYKGTNPTCHDFNALAATQESLLLVIGFSGGQIQLVDPISKEVNKLYNEDRVIDKTRVTCIRWIPNSLTLFLVSHGSGHMYLYNIDVCTAGTTSPSYQISKSGPSFTVYNCKSKTPRNPLTRWTIGDGAINEFAFSPCGQFVAIVSQDGFLRIFRYDNNELLGITRSYFGGLLCVCWSPDSKYVCVGGEDDLVTLWSFKEKRVVARGQGHKSWVSVVAFDPFTTSYGDTEASEDCNTGGETTGNCSHRHLSNDCQSSGVYLCDSVTTSGTSCVHQNNVSCSSCQQNSASGTGKTVVVNHVNNNPSSSSPPPTANVHNNCASNLNNVNRPSRHSRTSDSMRLSVSEPQTTRIPACYRLGSVGQDTQLCLWDLTEDVLKHPFGKSRPSSRVPISDTSPCIVHSSSKTCNSHHHHQNINISNTNMPNSNNSIVSNCNTVSNSVNHTSDRVDGDRNPASVINGGGGGTQTSTNTASSTSSSGNGTSSHNSTSGHGHGILSLRFGALGFGGDRDKNKDREHGKEHKRNFSLGSSSKSEKTSGSSGKTGGSASGAANFLASLGISVNLDDPLKLIGTQACPRLDECPLLEPLVCKKISHERLTALIFREESIVTTCQDGIVCTWARPGDNVSQL